jgi:hypothetical protein
MALWDLDEFLPGSLLPWVRMQPTPAAFAAVRWLPNQTINDLDFEYIKGARSRTVMAHVMGYDSEAPIAGRQLGGAKVQGQLPPIKRKSRIGEKEIIRFLTPRNGTTDQREAINSVYRDASDLIGSIQARVEWLRIKALSEPTVVYDESGVVFEFDFGLNKEYRLDITTGLDGDGNDISSIVGAAWSDHTNSTPVTDLQYLVNKVRDETGQTYAEVVFDSATINHMQASQELHLLARGSTGLPGILTQAEVDAVFARYGLPNVISYDVFVTREEENGDLVDERLLEAGHGFLVPTTPLGNTLWGPTAESLSLVGTALQGQAPGIFVNTYNTNEPVAEWVKAAAIAFPTIPNAHVLGQLKVRA